MQICFRLLRKASEKDAKKIIFKNLKLRESGDDVNEARYLNKEEISHRYKFKPVINYLKIELLFTGKKLALIF